MQIDTGAVIPEIVLEGEKGADTYTIDATTGTVKIVEHINNDANGFQTDNIVAFGSGHVPIEMEFYYDFENPDRKVEFVDSTDKSGLTLGTLALVIDAVFDAIETLGGTFDPLVDPTRDQWDFVDDDNLFGVGSDLFDENSDVRAFIEDVLGTYFGDVNLDGTVDAQDLNILGIWWQMLATSWGQADLNGDGFVDAEDLNIMALNWGN